MTVEMDDHPVVQALRGLRDLYAHEQRHLPLGTQIFLGRVWQEALSSTDRERAFCAFEVATLLALRNGTVWIDHNPTLAGDHSPVRCRERIPRFACRVREERVAGNPIRPTPTWNCA